MKVEIKLPFGLNMNNILVHIDDVERGKKCGCVCPCCRIPLIAAQGKEKQHHFKHDTGHECEGGLESSIHLAAKQIIKEKKRITLPEYISTAKEIDSRGIEHTAREIIVRSGKVIEFNSVQEEKTLHGMEADILAIKDGQPLIIEIFYRHKVKEDKLRKIAEANISAIEIDLSDLIPEDVKNWETFWSSINDPQRIQWLHNAKSHGRVYPRLKNQLALKIYALEKRYEQEKIRKQRQEEREKAPFLRAQADLKKLRSKEHIAQLNQKAETHPVWQRCKKYLSFSWHDLPDFLNAPVPDGDWIFGCDRRIWQTAFYGTFISKTGVSFTSKRVDDWFQKNGCKVPSSVKAVGIYYGKRYPKLPPDDMPSSLRTLKAYFWHLCELGMLEETGIDRRYPGSLWFRVIGKTPITIANDTLK